MDSSERTVYVLSVRRPTWDAPTELCRALTPEAIGQLVTVLTGVQVCDIIELRIEVRREVG
jgi:hypothetical protein